MNEVTDPELLKQLEGDAGGQEVTDPALLAQLEEGEPARELDPSKDSFEFERSAQYPHQGITTLAPSIDVALAPMMARDAVQAVRALPAAGRALKNAPSTIRQGLSDWFAKRAANQAIKSVGPSTANLEQMGEMVGGPEGLRNAGQYLLDKNVIKAGASAEEMVPKINELGEQAGKRIGEWRDTGDFRSIAQNKPRPTSLEIEQKIRAQLQSKYGPGAEAGQAGELDNAITEINKVAPIERSTAGEEIAGALDNVERKPPTTTFRTVNPNEAGPTPLMSESTRATHPYEEVRSLQEDIPEFFDDVPYLNDKPTYTELFDKSTRLNSVAKNARQLNQPSGAMTDAANILSRESTEGLEGLLRPDEKAAYAADRTEFGITEGLGKILDRTQYRDMGGANTVPMSKLGIVSQGMNTILPHTRVATYADKIAKALRANPEIFGRNAPALLEASRKGGNALGITTYMLQQRDAEFRASLRQLDGEDNDVK